MKKITRAFLFTFILASMLVVTGCGLFDRAREAVEETYDTWNLYTGEQYAMNNNSDTTKTVPWMNCTAHGAELLWANLAAEGGTFDSHKASLLGSGFSSNDSATSVDDWNEESYSAKNGVRFKDKNDNWKYYSLGGNVRCLNGATTGTNYAANIINSWRNPWKIMEAYRAVCYAVRNNIGELTWYSFEGNLYKWRSVDGFASPTQGEATCVVFKKMVTKCGASAVDPTDNITSIYGNRLEILVSTGLYHGMTTQVSPLWWTSGLTFTEDENGNYEAYMERNQSLLIKSENGEIDTSELFNFEQNYNHVGSFTRGEGYRKNYSNDAFMLPDTNTNKSGASLHTYVCAYNYFTGGVASANKKSVRGFLRGSNAGASNLSPLYVNANNAPSNTNSNYAFGK